MSVGFHNVPIIKVPAGHLTCVEYLKDRYMVMCGQLKMTVGGINVTSIV